MRAPARDDEPVRVREKSAERKGKVFNQQVYESWRMEYVAGMHRDRRMICLKEAVVVLGSHPYEDLFQHRGRPAAKTAKKRCAQTVVGKSGCKHFAAANVQRVRLQNLGIVIRECFVDEIEDNDEGR